MCSFTTCFLTRSKIDSIHNLKELSNQLKKCEQCNKQQQNIFTKKTYEKIRLKYVTKYTNANTIEKLTIL